jgi:1,4-alpha-glucan branching enzyme
MFEKERVRRKGKGEKRVEFSFYAIEAKEVFLAGEFNSWDTQSLPMKKDKNGVWKTKVKLPPGRYEYKLFADNAWIEDLSGAELVSNPFGTQNFVMRVQ